jgi:hypothetical protein
MEDTTMLDEATLASVLSRHFRTASHREVADAVQDVLLLELLEADDAGVTWEDAMQEPDNTSVTLFACARDES